MGLFGPSKKELQQKNNELEIELSKIRKSKEEIEEIQYNKINELEFKVKYIENSKEIELNKLKAQLEEISSLKEELKYVDLKDTIPKLQSEIFNLSTTKENIDILIKESQEKYDRLESELPSLNKRKKKIVLAFKSFEYAYTNNFISDETKEYTQFIEDLYPAVTLKLKCMDIKELKQQFKLNEEVISETLVKYEKRYTTKVNKSQYQLMVIALKAELQNVLYNLKFTTLDKSIELIREITSKYRTIASEGNQSIANTIITFVNEIEYLFLDAVKIEYEYYVKKEQQKQEQQALREQMKQEAEENKELERQKKQIDKEEQKYLNEIEKLKEQLLLNQKSSLEKDSEKENQFNQKILELEEQLKSIEDKKDDIIKRQNGKAGNVYIISNLGSFGENVFKIGMTRRIDPFERVKELSSASVPFGFDIHSFIFSDDAVGLEQKLHSLLDKNRVNKVNIRKEFFKVSIDQLENLVNEIDPIAEFNKTMIAEEFKQSLSY